MLALLMVLAHTRAYKVEQNSRNTQRRHQIRGRRGQSRWKSSHIPSHMRPLQPFPDWLTIAVEVRMTWRSRSINQTTVDLSTPPSPIPTTYRSMKAYSMHFRRRSLKASSTTTDSGVHATFDNDVEGETEKYARWIKEILELEYRGTCVVIFLYSWVKSKVRGVGTTMKRDQYGFLSMNFTDHSKLPFGPHSFAFPIHCQQVYFVVDEGL